jgi:hypothetical protein
LLADEDGCGELLRSLCQSVARKGGERVFIRLHNQDPLVTVAALRGFALCGHELLYRGVARPAADERSAGIRERTGSDTYNLYRLFSTAAPREARLSCGLNLDQWASSCERWPRHSREFVQEMDGVIAGWGVTARQAAIGKIRLTVHPDHEQTVASLLNHGLSQLSASKTAYCIVSQDQVLLQRLLEQRGFQVAGEYVTMVRSLVVSASNEESRRAVRIPSV